MGNFVPSVMPAVQLESTDCTFSSATTYKDLGEKNRRVTGSNHETLWYIRSASACGVDIGPRVWWYCDGCAAAVASCCTIKRCRVVF
eukprot:1496039-Rhodomonas_salina.4